MGSQNLWSSYDIPRRSHWTYLVLIDDDNCEVGNMDGCFCKSNHNNSHYLFHCRYKNLLMIYLIVVHDSLKMMKHLTIVCAFDNLRTVVVVYHHDPQTTQKTPNDEDTVI